VQLLPRRAAGWLDDGDELRRRGGRPAQKQNLRPTQQRHGSLRAARGIHERRRYEEVRCSCKL
jgi:hypothetical protein